MVGIFVGNKGSILAGFVVGFMLGVISFFVGIGVYNMKTTNTLYDTIYLESIKDNRTQESSYVFGCGGSSSSMKYTFYAKEPNGRIKLYEISSDCTEIVYSTESPRIERYRDFVNPTDKTNLFMRPKRAKRGGPYAWGNTTYIIYVPQGTITNEFQLDAK